MAETTIPLEILDSKSNAKLDADTKRLLVDSLSRIGDESNSANMDNRGGRVSLPVTDQINNELLKEVLAELKKINIHLYSITDERISK